MEDSGSVQVDKLAGRHIKLSCVEANPRASSDDDDDEVIEH